MIISERQVHHGVHNHLALHNSGPVVDRVNAQDGGLRRVENGGAKKRAEHASIRDGECAAGHVLLSDGIVARLAACKHTNTLDKAKKTKKQNKTTIIK